MKRILTLVAAFLTIAVMSSFVYIEKKDKAMKILWEKYEKAAKEDKVQEMADILEDIKAKALFKKASWDYYKACDEYFNVKSRRNWKLADSLRTATETELREFGHYLLEVIYALEHYNGAETASRIIKEEAENLKGRVSPDIYRVPGLLESGQPKEFNKLMAASVKDDYEFALWMLALRRGTSYSWAYDKLIDYLGNTYPAVPYARFRRITDNNDADNKLLRLEELAREYAGTAMELVIMDEIYFQRLHQNKTDMTSTEYKAFATELEDFVKKVKALKGEEKAIGELCHHASGILKELNKKDASVSIKNGKAKLLFRNLDKAVLRIEKDNKVVFKTLVENDIRSFYLADTIAVKLPALNDGEYRLKVLDGSKEIYENYYNYYYKYTVSLAWRSAGDGLGVYAADYLTGEPLTKADLVLCDMDMKELEVFSDFTFDGFTPLPEYEFVENKRYYLSCRYQHSGITHMSRPALIRYSGGKVQHEDRDFVSALIMKDRAAFVPGDTLRFKAILYETAPDGSMKTLPEGREVIARLRDSRDKEILSLALKTNGYGSVSGSFEIDKNQRNGSWTISVEYNNQLIDHSRLTVDEFVLPTYDVEFETSQEIYFPGDEVRVKGYVKNYTGHGFEGLKAVASVRTGSDIMPETSIDISADGSFEIPFIAGEADDDYISYEVFLKLTAHTGETLEFSNAGFISKDLYLSAELQNKGDGHFHIKNSFKSMLLAERTGKFRCEVDGIKSDDIPIHYKLKSAGVAVREGTSHSGESFMIDFEGLAAGLYEFAMESKVKNVELTETYNLLYLPEDSTILPAEVEKIFCKIGKEGEISVQLGSGTGDIWAVVELFGEAGKSLKQSIVKVKAGELATISYPYLEDYSDELKMNVFWFRDGESHRYSQIFSRPEERKDFPLEFITSIDKAMPGQKCELVLKAATSSEVAATVFDASSEKIQANDWNTVSKRRFSRNLYIMTAEGCDKGGSEHLYGNVIKQKVALKPLAVDSAVEEESAVRYTVAASEEAAAGVKIRDDFSTTLAFSPFLYPDADGKVTLTFFTSDKLSTFKVLVYAHDTDMHNLSASKELLVTLPAKVEVMAPQYLHAGDKYILNTAVSNTLGTALTGKVRLEVFDGKDYKGSEPLMTASTYVDIPAGGSISAGFEINVPEGVDTLGIKVVFADTVISDGVFIPVPVYPAAEVLTEAHSAVLLGGQAEETVLAELRKKFVNTSSAGAEYSEITIMDMIREAVPMGYEAEGKDAISLSEAMFVNFMAADLHKGDEADARKCIEAAMNSAATLLKYTNSDGGFGWFEDMPSSPIITALVLERYAGLRDRGLLDAAQPVWGQDSLDDLDSAVYQAVKYLDSSYFKDSDRPFWYGRLSIGQYLNVRLMFSGVEFDKKAVEGKALKEFKKSVKEYLMKDTQGQILEKVRRIRIIDILSQNSCETLAKSWGIKVGKNMVNSRNVLAESLKQYAVKHPSGGLYYPNAVLQWRGLLESEAYAHAQICNLGSELAASDKEWNEIADGIRLWLMLQKETQAWTSDAGYIEALAAVYDGSSTVKNTKIIILKKSYLKPFNEIKAAGNGFTVGVEYYKAGDAGEPVRLAEGDILHIGDKITAKYSIWSEENRSYVRLSVPRAACLRPVNQLSGYSGGWFRPLRYGVINVSPYSYREVKADRSLYWIDILPEEKTTLEEEFFVTAEGVFSSPVAEIESLYAPHYRACDSWHGEMVTSSIQSW